MAQDFFFVCPSHLKDRKFCSPIVDEGAAEAKRKREMEEEVERARKEYEERKRKKEEEDKKKEEEDKKKEEEKEKDGEKKDEKEKEKEKGKDDKAKEEEEKKASPSLQTDRNDFLTASRRKPAPRHRHQMKNPGSLPSSGEPSSPPSSSPPRNAVTNVSQRLLQPASLEEARGRGG